MDEVEMTAELLRVAPREFVAARNTKVAELRAAGASDVAVRVAKLRRPRPEQWALNVVAHTDPELVDRWVVAAGAVRDAQNEAAAGTRRSDLRELLTELRRRTNDLVAVAPRSPAPALPAELAEIAGSGEAAAAFRAGLLGARLDDQQLAAPASKGAGRGTKASPRKRSLSTVDEDGSDSRAAQREAEHRLSTAAAKLADAESTAASALDAVDTSERELAAAEEAVADARRALETAEDQRREAKARQAHARRQHLTANKRVDTARRAHAVAADRLVAIRRDADD